MKSEAGEEVPLSREKEAKTGNRDKEWKQRTGEECGRFSGARKWGKVTPKKGNHLCAPVQ